MKMNRAVLIPTTCKSSDEDTEVPEIKEKRGLDYISNK